ncbi:hypothetical protein PYW08_007189 [Mythimna loreyi]|uniref:Uncharacterized protein n=1 Tax=Mythimna loreyi TaxID=667449 RepID=A0ACC2RB57_9NEOP|nr:hypothetical protein PYW08_007189 [Mythimna loreyi]
MDAKDLRTESAVSERNNDGSKYSQGGGIAVHYDRNKSYQDIGSNSLGKVDVPNARPCAVIGPDRIVPPPAASEAYHLKKSPAEPWPCMDVAYRRPPEYPHKLTNYQNPTRNISPRQTFQENMQRIMVPPTYSSIKVNEDTNYAQVSDRSNGLTKNIKLNMPPEAKFCDVPFAVNPTNEHKNVRNPEMCLPSVNSTHTRTAPHGWPPGSVNLRSTRMYGGPELYQYQDYPSCAGPRPIVPRPHRTVPEEQGYVYADPYYQEGNLRFKPYPTSKERYPQQRYEYIGNFSNPFHPPPGFPSHKYEVHKTMPPQPYPPYPPIKYLDSRVADPVIEGYQRNPQGLGPNYNIQYRNQVIHPNYGPVVGSGPQSKLHSYPPDAHLKTLPPNKLPYDSNAKAYIEYENSRPKIYPPPESYFINEMTRLPMKSQVIMPNYSALNMHNIPPNAYYKKDTQHIKNYEHMAHFRNIEPNSNIHNPMTRHAPVFSPNTLAISPTDSNTSNDTTQTLGTSQEDCGYVSQSSTASVRSMDSSINRIPNEYVRKYYENRYGPIVRTSPMMQKSQSNSNNNTSKDKKQIDVRQFLQMWNEGDEEQEENSSKEITIQTGSSDKSNFSKSHPHEAINSQQTQEQLYVLGLVNVPSEELAKYEHIQKVSKLPENIKGYNSIELLNQFEEVIESSHMKNYKSPTPKESIYHIPPIKGHQKQATGIIPPRPVSPLDVEAKISQSVIHKDVGCNFEIKPCSPQMLNVDVAAPVQNILAERSIEKVANPVMLRSPMLNGLNENIDCDMMTRTDHRMNINENLRIPSCKMINTQYSNNSIDPMKSSYTIHDLESNSGLCLASLPRLDNDIELNFPEVNQQFINANKGDKTVLANSIRDLPTLEVLDQSHNQIKDKFNNTNQLRPEYNIDKSPYMSETEKEFSKLSKFRKSKTFDPKENLLPQNVNALRTDSVIIKNPENIKNHEENSNFASTLNKVITDIQQSPINLTSQGNFVSNVTNPPDTIDLQVADKEKQELPVEIAIDFSLNKTSTLNSTVYVDTKIESQMSSATQMEGIPLNTFNKHNSSDSVHSLPVFTKQNEKLTNINNNCRFDSFKDNHEISKPIAEINKYNYEVEFKEIPDTNDSYQNIERKKNKCTSNSAEEMTIDVSSTQSPSPSKMASDQLVSDINSENCEKEICSGGDSTTHQLTDDANYTLTEIDSKISLHLTKSLENEYERGSTNNIRKDSIDEDSDDSNFANKFNSPIQSVTNMDFDDSDVNNPSKITDPIGNDQTQPIKKDLSTREETCSKDSDSPDLNTSSESRTILADYTIDHVNDNIESTTSESSEGNSDREKELKDLREPYCENTRSTQNNFEGRFCEDTQSSLENFEETYCTDTTSSPENTDECDIDPPAANVLVEEPILRNFWYGSKELYSPWIQKLLTFSEGNFNSLNNKNHMDNKNYDFVDSTNTVTTESNNDHNVSNFETRKSDPVKAEETTENNDDHDDSDNGMTKPVTVEVTSENDYDHNDTDIEMKKLIPIVENTTENYDDHNNNDFEMSKIPITEVISENKDDHNNTDFKTRTSVPVEKVTSENNDDNNDSDFKIKKSVSLQNISTENIDDFDDIDFEMRKSVSVEKITTIKNNNHDDSDFEMKKPVPEEVSSINNDNHEDFEIRKSRPVKEDTSKNNDDHENADFDLRKSVPIIKVTSENSDGHESADFEIRKSVPAEVASIKNDNHKHTDFEMRKSRPLEEVTSENNNDHEDTDIDMRKSVPVEKVTTIKDDNHDDSDIEKSKSVPTEATSVNNDDHEDTGFEMRISEPIVEVTPESNDDLVDSVSDLNKPNTLETRPTENYYDSDDSDFELKQSVPLKHVITENNYDSDFETRKSIPLGKVTTKNNYDHNDSNFEIQKSVPLKELSIENSDYQAEALKVSTENKYDHYDSDFETRKSAPLEEVITESNDDSDFEPRKAIALGEISTENNYNHYDSDFETRKLVSLQEVATDSNDGHDDSDFEPRKAVALEEISTKNKYNHNNSDFETRILVPLQAVTTDSNDGHDDSDFEPREAVSLEEISTENNNNHNDSDFETRILVPIEEVATDSNDGHDDSDFEPRKAVALEEISTENNYNHNDSEFETRKLVPLQEVVTESNDGHEDFDFGPEKQLLEEVTTENNYNQYDSDFERNKSVPPEEVTIENYDDHDDSDFEIRKPIPVEEVTTENNYEHDDSDFETSKSLSLESATSENNSEDVSEKQGNSNDIINQTIVTGASKSCTSNKNLEETVNPQDHFEYRHITIDEAIKHKQNEHSVDEVNNVAIAGTSSVACESNDTTTINSFIISESNNNENTNITSETQLNRDIETECEAPDTSNVEFLCESSQEKTEHCGDEPEYKVPELESSDHFEQVQFSLNGLQTNSISYKKSQRLKRSLSESALNVYNNDEQIKQECEENVQFIWPFKRRKMNTVANDLAQNLCSIINHNRRNSVSSFYNEDNVSFCILIDNSCIITEEENEEPDKVCYTELSEECLAEIQSSCTKQDENIDTLTEVAMSPQQEDVRENSDSFMLDYEEDKTLEETWDDDVGCVETVISDDIAEDIEISGASPKDVALSDNDESGVFSCNEHTDKVKFIYGDKMCTDDALFVETLYKTPQMDVNKTLYNRETRVSKEYDSYYDNDSLEKMLSESNEPPVSPYVPQYTEKMFTTGKVNSKEESPPNNKENMDAETYPPFQSKGNGLDIVVDINVDKIERESMHSIEIFAKTRDDNTQSCESSVDNVFTYNQKDEDAIYTSSSPEVSSTTSEEKNSGILLKITNYQGSRISQINDISRVNNRSSCKFTEEKEYLHTHANYSSNRPLLTKAAQKYIPPLRETIRDLKVKLTLPQHSLMKLKQLKISKDEPKVNKSNATIPRIPKKPKPKFEDVLKSIDEIQFKKHKENTKKTKKSIPKVVIKKNRNGSHYASTSSKDNFNPDLTGRKWQPWVFIEKNNFIDKMAIRKKTKAIYSHRKKTYVLAEKFQKYKSASSAKFVITPPISDKPSSGLKYTIRLKHNY